MIDVTDVKWVVTGTGNVTQKDFVSIVTSAKVSTPKFIDIYYDFLKNTKSSRTAYERTEILHEEIFGTRKFNSYDKFKVIRSYHLKKR